MPLEERTEVATPRRREEVRQRGQVARSQEFTAVCVVMAGVLYLRGNGQSLADQTTRLFLDAFERMRGPDLTQPEIFTYTLGIAMWTAVTLGPLFMIAALTGIAANLLQVGFLFTGQPLMPDPNRINPLQGFQRIVSGHSLVELLKALFKLIVSGFVLYRVLASHWEEILVMPAMSLPEATMLTTAIIGDLALYVAASLLVLAALDYAYQRYQFEQSIKMTIQEVKEELKQTEGNPQIRARIRQLQRVVAQRRMMAAVPRAAVVITNPTHFAVALEYEPRTMRAPRVVAKGQDFLALRIREVAEAHGVPLVENKPLAQTLYRTVEIDQEIPATLYKAVAEVMAFIFALRKRRGNGRE